MRLIDADALIERIEKDIKAIEGKEPQIAMGAIGVLNMIKRPPTPKDEERITIQTGQTYGKSAYVAGDPDTDLISRQAATSIPILPKEKRKKFKDYDDAFETGWLEALACVNMIPPAEPKSATDDCISRQEAIEEIASHDPTNGTEPYFSGHEVIDILKCVPTVTHAKRTETHGVCSDYISRQAAIECCSCLHPEDCWAEIKALPPVEPERPKRTETMMVDGEPTEIDPLSYEVGYSHGQSERPRGEWIETEHSTNENVFEKWIEIRCPFCGHEPVYENIDDMEFCPKCGADMRVDK